MHQSELLYVAALPLAVAAIVTLAGRPLRLNAPTAWAMSVAFGYVAGQLGLATRTGDALSEFLHPREAAGWLPHAVLLALCATILAIGAPRPWNRAGIALAILLIIGLPVRLLHGSAYDLRWTLLEKSAAISLLAIALGLMWLALASVTEADHRRLRPVLLIVVTCIIAVVVSLSGVLVYGELCGVLAAALTGAFLASRTPHVAASAGVVTVSLGSLTLLSSFYAELTPTNAALLITAILVAAGPIPAVMSPRPERLKAALRVALTLLPLSIALLQTIAANRAPAAASPYWQ